MSPEFLAGVRSVSNIFAIKESSGSIARLHELLANFASRYEIVCGADDQALEYFMWGSRSWVAGASNFLPAQHVALYEACVLKQDLKAGRSLMEALLPVFMLMEQGGKDPVTFSNTAASWPVYPSVKRAVPCCRSMMRRKLHFGTSTHVRSV